MVVNRMLLQICICCVLSAYGVCEQPQSMKNVHAGVLYSESFDEIYGDSYGDEFDELDQMLADKQELSFSTIYEYLKEGRTDALIEYIFSSLWDSIFYEIKGSHSIMVQILAIIVIGTIFSNLSGRFGSFVGGNGFFVTYLILISMLLGSFTLVNSIAVETVNRITEFMMVFIPTYAMAAGYANGENTAKLSYEMIIIAIYLCENILCRIVFPIIKCSGIIALINRINSEDYFSKTVSLMRSAAKWIMKTMLAVLTGLNLVKGIVTPALDKLERNTFMKVVGAMPGGSAAESVASILLGSGMLIKNCIGIAGAVVLLVISILPVVKIAIIFLSLKVVSALVQPLSDKRFSEGVHAMATTISLMLKGIWIAVLMFIVSITMLSVLAK